MTFKLVDSLREAMHVRALRNACRLDLTNSTEHIGFVRQLHWYFGDYRRERRSANYRVYLLYEQGVPIGYGALALQNEELLVTECVAPAHRGQGYGNMILKGLTQIAVDERRDLAAEIWANNSPSLALHKSAGFELVSRATKDGKELQRHRLSLNKT